MKYHRNLGLGDTLSEVLVSSIQELRWSVDQIIPIPLSNQRYKERGYNQIAIVAFPLSLQLNINFSSKALLRKKHTRSQVGLSAEERKANVEGAFWADPEKVKEKTVLIMDDVATTGSTLAAASQALVDAGASKVYAFTIARALSHHGLNIA